MSANRPRKLLPGAKTIRRLLFLYAIQALLSISAAIFFIQNQHASQLMYNKLSFLAKYIPILWRYQTLFIQERREIEFPAVFCIYFFYIVVQVVCLTIVAVSLLPLLDFRLRRKLPQLNRGAAFFLLLLWIFANVDLLWADMILVRATCSQFFLIFGNYRSGVIFRSFTPPVSNLTIIFILFAQFGKFDPELLRPFAERKID